ncbi:MAG: alpha/beta hydrolase-fold protein [Pseudomonadales bacterium]
MTRALLTLTILLSSLWTCVALAAARTAADDERSIDDPRVEHRSYEFPATGERIPYALFVPSGYDAARPAPLLVSLHGLGRTYDWLMGYHGLLDAAEAGGYVVVTPLGYTRRGWYGSWQTDTDGRELGDEAKRSEQDVMNVLVRVREEFSIDPARMYLWGHSMGGSGTYHLAAKYPDLWAAIGVVAPAAPQGVEAADLLARIRHIPSIVMHGTEDELVPVALTRSWVDAMAALGMQHVYVEIPGGDHSLLISQNRDNMAKIVGFFDVVSLNDRRRN